MEKKETSFRKVLMKNMVYYEYNIVFHHDSLKRP